MNLDPTILMVDDDLVTNFIVERKLQQVGIHANLEFVENGKDAFDWIESNIIPHVILLDISMPIMDGYEFLKEWVERGFEGKSCIWVLTSTINDEITKRLNMFNDIEGFFEKPLNQMNIDVMLSKLKPNPKH